MDTTLFRVIDFETTGFPPEAGIVEVGWCDVIRTDLIRGGEPTYDIEVKGWESQLTNPGIKIETAAKAIHHILDEDLVGMKHPNEVLDSISEGVDYFVAHNAKFEKEFFKTTVPWICTLKGAYRLCPKAPNHQNQTIRYFLNTPVPREDAIHTHRAGPDALVTAYTLAKFLSAVDPNILAKWEQEPPLLPYCPIGKQKGQPWSEIERGFLAWCTRQPTMEEDILWNVKRELDRRDGKLRD